MAEHILKNTKIYIDGVDLSGKMNTVNILYNAELKDKTAFGSSCRKRAMGLKTVEISGAGFYDASTQYGQDKVVWDDVGSTDQICTVIAEGTALGNVAYSAQKLGSEYSPSFQIGEMAAWNFACYGVGALIRQRVMQAGSLSTSLSATVRNLGYRTQKQYLFATLHNIRGTTAAGAKLVVKIQSAASSGFGSLSTELKFTTLTTAIHSAQWKTTQSSTTNNWYRIKINSSGSTDGTFNGIVTLGLQ